MGEGMPKAKVVQEQVPSSSRHELMTIIDIHADAIKSDLSGISDAAKQLYIDMALRKETRQGMIDKLTEKARQAIERSVPKDAEQWMGLHGDAS